MKQTFALHSINSFLEITLIQINDTPLPKWSMSLGKFCFQTSTGVFKMQGYVLQLAGKQHTSACSQSNICFIPAVKGHRSGSPHTFGASPSLVGSLYGKQAHKLKTDRTTNT